MLFSDAESANPQRQLSARKGLGVLTVIELGGNAWQ
jgi:hypothetical protein